MFIDDIDYERVPIKDLKPDVAYDLSSLFKFEGNLVSFEILDSDNTKIELNKLPKPVT